MDVQSPNFSGMAFSKLGGGLRSETSIVGRNHQADAAVNNISIINANDIKLEVFLSFTEVAPIDALFAIDVQ